MNDTTGRGPHFVRSVERALAIMRAFTAQNPALTLSEVAATTGLDEATVRGLLLTLADLGYLRSDDDIFRLTPHTLDLGHAYLAGLALPDLAQPHLHALAHAFDETAALGILDGNDIVYLAHATSRRLPHVKILAGSRFPAWATSAGRVLLTGTADDELDTRLERLDVTGWTVAEVRAELECIRSRGWALAEHDLDADLRGVAAPIRNRRGRLVAAVTVSAPSERTTPAIMGREYVPELLRTARLIEADLATSHAPQP